MTQVGAGYRGRVAEGRIIGMPAPPFAGDEQTSGSLPFFGEGTGAGGQRHDF